VQQIAAMGTVIFSAYDGEQRDLRWVSLSLSAMALILLMMRLWATWQNRGWFGLEDAFVIAATVRAFHYRKTDCTAC